MANRDDIITLPNSHLRTRSKRITIIDQKINKLVSDMKSATLDWEKSRQHEVGVALAAIQIDQPYRVVIIRTDIDDKKSKSFEVLINPEIVKKEGEPVEDYEGCLSIKDIYGKVKRYPKVKVKALNVFGKPFRITAEGFLARILQHEIDHNNGTLFIDHIKDEPNNFYKLAGDGKLKNLDFEKDIKDNPDLWED